MKAAVIRQHGGPERLVLEADFPDPSPSAGEVLVRVAASALNYHDVFTRNGMPGIKIPMPMIMGIDLAGEVVGIGPDVTGWSPGDRVLVDPVDRASHTGLIGETRHGGLAELCSVPAQHLIRLPDDVAYADAAALPVAYGTAHRMMIMQGRVTAGEKVLILGASGGVGTCCVLLAKMMGAEVVACASTPGKLARLKALGADHLIDYSRDDIVKEVYRLFGKPHRRTYDGGVDVVVNFTGGETWTPSLRSLRRGGRLLTCGATAGFEAKVDARYVWTFEQTIRGSNGWTRDDLTALIDLCRLGRLKPVIDRVLPLEESVEAFRLLENRQVFGKILVQP